jgi:signal transduction histidine kinase
VSKIESGQLALNKSIFNLSDLINDCCTHIRLADTHELILEGDLSLEVFADKQRIDQVMVNFVNNAVKYAPGSEKITLTIENAGEEAKISVTDKGIGIEEEKLPYLFDRYYRVDPSGMQYSGLGLGLYISAEIIKLHEGRIGVNSKKGAGSTFWFTIPLT